MLALAAVVDKCCCCCCVNVVVVVGEPVLLFSSAPLFGLTAKLLNILYKSASCLFPSTCDVEKTKRMPGM